MSQLRIVPLGGLGHVTQNMFVYEYEDEMLIVDCGIGFPDQYMPGVDILIPDYSYLLDRVEKGKRIVGMILSHGHDDHIAATPYILPYLPEFPLYASPLTEAFARQRLRDGTVERTITVVNSSKEVKVSESFSFQLFAMTHSVPDTRHIGIITPAGAYYHGSDFKLDDTPVDNRPPAYDEIKQFVAEHPVRCMLIDCLRVEHQGHIPSESEVGPVIDRLMEATTGKFIITLMSSHIHRIQHAVNAAKKYGRKVVFVGRSVEQNVSAARELDQLIIDPDQMVDKKYVQDYSDDKLCIVIAGSQGQEGSSMVRAVYGDHPMIHIHSQDVVVFSADAIPGNEVPYYSAIDELCRNGVHVVYPDVEPGIHQSGHAGAIEQRQMLELVHPDYVMPIGGADRHREKFLEFVALPAGYSKERVLIPRIGEILGVDEHTAQVVERISLTPQIVDGLGVGDVGPVVLADRRALSEAGMIVIVIPRRGGEILWDSIQVVSRGFVFMQQADDVIEFILGETKKILRSTEETQEANLLRSLTRQMAKKLHKIIRREPLIVPVFVEC